MISVDDQLIINKVKRTIRAWKILRYILIGFLVALFITAIVMLITVKNIRFLFLYCWALTSLIGACAGITIGNWDGSKKDLLIIKLSEQLDTNEK
jgi:hypothetical protein